MTDIQTTSVSLIMGSRGIKLDARGRIQFVNPDILQAILTASPTGVAAAADGNTIQCVCNNYQCGKKTAEIGDEVTDVGRTSKSK